MKRLLFAAWGFLLFVSGGLAQENPVKWACSVNYLDGNQAELVMKATVEGGYHLYSQFMEDGGPIPTVQFSRIGRLQEKRQGFRKPQAYRGNRRDFRHAGAFFRQERRIQAKDNHPFGR